MFDLTARRLLPLCLASLIMACGAASALSGKHPTSHDRPPWVAGGTRIDLDTLVGVADVPVKSGDPELARRQAISLAQSEIPRMLEVWRASQWRACADRYSTIWFRIQFDEAQSMSKGLRELVKNVSERAATTLIRSEAWFDADHGRWYAVAISDARRLGRVSRAEAAMHRLLLEWLDLNRGRTFAQVARADHCVLELRSEPQDRPYDDPSPAAEWP